MTDAEFEWRTNLAAIRAMRGDVLIAGLGLGFMILPTLEKREVSAVTVIENNADVIKLIAPQITTEKLQVIHADARTFEPQKRSYDCVYLDIWANVPNYDDWKDIKKLKRKYRKALRPKGWIAAWCEDMCA